MSWRDEIGAFLAVFASWRDFNLARPLINCGAASSYSSLTRESARDGGLPPPSRYVSIDQYRSLLIFNIRHNYYRLIVKVDYRAKLLMVKEFLTHKEYT